MDARSSTADLGDRPQPPVGDRDPGSSSEDGTHCQDTHCQDLQREAAACRLAQARVHPPQPAPQPAHHPSTVSLSFTVPRRSVRAAPLCTVHTAQTLPSSWKESQQPTRDHRATHTKLPVVWRLAARAAALHAPCTCGVFPRRRACKRCCWRRRALCAPSTVPCGASRRMRCSRAPLLLTLTLTLTLPLTLTLTLTLTLPLTRRGGRCLDVRGLRAACKRRGRRQRRCGRRVPAAVPAAPLNCSPTRPQPHSPAAPLACNPTRACNSSSLRPHHVPATLLAHPLALPVTYQ